MPLRVAIQMDPVESIDIRGDTSFASGLKPARPRASLLSSRQPDLAGGRPEALCRTLELRHGRRPFYGRMEVRQGLATFDVILMRQDPPFDMAYITATHLLEMLPPATMVVNNRPRCATLRKSCLSPCSPI